LVPETAVPIPIPIPKPIPPPLILGMECSNL
jgi:hypothetical protein